MMADFRLTVEQHLAPECNRYLRHEFVGYANEDDVSHKGLDIKTSVTQPPHETKPSH